MSLVARGSLALDGIFNPFAFPQSLLNLGSTTSSRRTSPSRSYFYSYSGDSAAELVSVGGPISLRNTQNQSIAWNARLNTPRVGGTGQLPDELYWIYPSTLRAVAMSSDIVLGSNKFDLFPSAVGSLDLLAGGSVRFGGGVRMSDVVASDMPGVWQPVAPIGQQVEPPGMDTAWTDTRWSDPRYHSQPPLHADDHAPIRIVAADGDIIGDTDSAVAFLPKPATIDAGRDIENLWIYLQNLRPGDVTRIRAGRDVRFTTERGPGNALQGNQGSISLGGPGRLEVIAGRDVDLATSGGIVTRGNLDNPYLPEGGAEIMVLAGVPQTPNRSGFVQTYLRPEADSAQSREYREKLRAFMNARRRSGEPELDEQAALTRFEALSADDQTAFLNQVLWNELRVWGGQALDRKSEHFGNYARAIDAIKLMFPGAYGDDPTIPGSDSHHSPYRGDIKLYFSQIKTEQGGGIELLAPGGSINAGLAATSGFTKDAAQLGIITAAGGPIQALVWRDILVNQSRIFTLQGGDILLWAAKGDIDAGRGKRAVSATPPPRLRVTATGAIVLDLSGSVAGSGIGALRANPDVPESDVYLFAPEGTVNAGDAGIRASRNLTIGAERVIGADVIQAGGTTVGVPVDAAGATAGLASLGSAASSATKSGEDGLKTVEKRAVQDEEGNVSFIDVEVLGFGQAPTSEPAQKQDDEKRR